MDIVKKFEQEQIERLMQGKSHPDFMPGDTLKVWVKIKDGANEREQAYEGVCIAFKRRGLNSAFTVRKISYGEGVERVFPLYSPNIRIDIVRQGSVRRAKLYYLRELTGKKARIPAKKRGLKGKRPIINATSAS